MGKNDLFNSALGASAALLLSAAPVAAQDQLAALALPDRLRDLSLEELTQIEVTSASKRAEPLSEVANALFVINADDIRRSGYTSLPEVLRLAPNLDVRRINAREYAITARGFGGYETARQLLVLIDGRSVYSTLFSGVLWELREVPLENIERIEVISGPGGTLYGLNAVNGVVNIITKDAAATAGLTARATAGAGERTGLLRYGGALGDRGAYRVYLSAYDRDDFADGPGPDVNDGGEGLRTGFRADWGGSRSRVTLQGDYFRNDSNVSPGNGEKGGNLRLRWDRTLSAAAEVQLQAYYEAYDRDFLLVSDDLDIADVEAQLSWTSGRHRLVAGGGLRTNRDKFVNNLGFFNLEPMEKRLWLGNVFVQDRFALTDELALTAGIKFEKTSYTGVEFLPNLRLSYHPTPSALLWAAVSRAIRTPSRIDRDLQEPGILLAGTFDPEELTAFEAGYRGQLSPRASLSVSLFYNRYDGLRTTEPASATSILPVRLENGLEGETFGIEAWATAELASWWRLSAGVATLDKDFALKAGRVDIENGISLGNDADVQGRLRSQMNLASNLELDVMLRAVDELPDPAVDGYVEADARLAWRPSEAVELFVAGRNLLHDHRDESGDAERGQLLPRSVVAGTRLTV